MKGIIFNLVEEVLAEEAGPDAWDELLDRCGLDGIYTALGSYDDAELLALLDEGARMLDLSRPDLERLLGRRSFPHLADRWAELLADLHDVRTLLRNLDEAVHREVEKLYPDASTPTFDTEQLDDGSLWVHYSSARRLCHLAEGFIVGAGDRYGTPVQVEQRQCMHDGADACILHCTFPAGPP